MVGRDEREPLSQFAEQLRALRNSSGAPSLRRLERLTGSLGNRLAPSTIAEKLNGQSRPDWEFVKIYVWACALQDGVSPGSLHEVDLSEWKVAHQDLIQELANERAGRRRAFEAETELVGQISTMPADALASTFTGRTKEIASLVEQVSDRGGQGETLMVYSIDGMPGVGKSSLVMYAANLLTQDFPDGQFFLNLHAHTDGHPPLAPESALASLLLLQGIGPRQMPQSLPDRSALWRRCTTGKRIMLVLDNASSSATISPLLPGSGRSVVLVTSRRRLTDLPAVAVTVMTTLNVMSQSESEVMFMRLAPRARTESPLEVRKLLDMTGNLPLANSLLARVYESHPTWDLKYLTQRASVQMLDLRSEEQTVKAAFNLSYEALPTAQKRLFCLLSTHPGSEISVKAACALSGLASTVAAELLEDLWRNHLLIELQPERYALHDLIRSYARERAALDIEDGGRGAFKLLCNYYASTARTADGQLTRRSRPGAQRISPQRASFDILNRSTSLQWFRSERANLLACVTEALSRSMHMEIVELIYPLATFLRQDGPWPEATEIMKSAVTSARLVRNPILLANALSDLAHLTYMSSQFASSIESLQEAQDIYTREQHVQGRANTLNDLGAVHYLMGQQLVARKIFDEALALCRAIADAHGEADALHYLGNIQWAQGNYIGAEQDLSTALSIRRKLEDENGEANALVTLGTIHRLQGRHSAAITDLNTALELYRYYAAPQGVANSLFGLGMTHRAEGDLAKAESCYLESLRIYRSRGDIATQAELQNELGDMYLSQKDFNSAREHHVHALALARSLPNVALEAHAKISLFLCEAVSLPHAERIDEVNGWLADLYDAGAIQLAQNLAKQLPWTPILEP
ncbi:tetratricopeptide repeat protein [Kineosporia rhizophila]|uniref:tetratricopeptide repeat protein n=1 Tax=Kineosporia rhizophila TaxID=84633 RepID=UPI001E49A0E7|nr:tetratricopeptide repeat protein [Kineosporia rhizophila]MCE0538639.1 tetratricopeptide repeat protein [Kineosporia rhizophila]